MLSGLDGVSLVPQPPQHDTPELADAKFHGFPQLESLRYNDPQLAIVTPTRSVGPRDLAGLFGLDAKWQPHRYGTKVRDLGHFRIHRAESRQVLPIHVRDERLNRDS